MLDDWDYGFAENGLTAFKLGQPLPTKSCIEYIGEERYKKLVNFVLHYIADLDIPIKRYAIEPLSGYESDQCAGGPLSSSARA